MSSDRRITLAGQDLAFSESGGTGRPVIFVHGNSSSARVWHPLLDGAFGERFRSLAVDLPGHGTSAPAADPDTYSIPGYASVLAAFAEATGAEDAVIVGWSLGGHIALEAASALPEAAGFVIFGTPSVSGPADLGEAFLPNPAVGIGFIAAVDAEQAKTYAESFLIAGSTLPTGELVEDILATDGAARENLVASLQTGRFADEVEIVAGLKQPIAVLQGAGEQLVNGDYLRRLAIPTLWRGDIQVLPGVGHAPQVEAPEEFADVLTQFIDDLA
jgi:pimeloyl-ACP methyl ester carboxylesterase